MSAENLTFDDKIFDLSIANFVVFLTPGNGIPAIRHMYRTLRPGGMAIYTAWAQLPHAEPVKAAYLATRGADGPSLRELPLGWCLGSHFKNVAIEAGFDEGKVDLQSITVYITVNDLNHFARVLWSYLGPSVTGWAKSDEVEWDNAINIIVERFKNTN